MNGKILNTDDKNAQIWTVNSSGAIISQDANNEFYLRKLTFCGIFLHYNLNREKIPVLICSDFTFMSCDDCMRNRQTYSESAGA